MQFKETQQIKYKQTLIGEIQRLKKENLSNAVIGKLLGYTPQRIGQILQEIDALDRNQGHGGAI